MLSIEQNNLERLYTLLGEEDDPDNKAVLRWAIYEIENPQTAQKPDTMTKKDYFTISGYLESLKVVLRQKTTAASRHGDMIGDGLAAEYTKRAREITIMQRKIESKAERMEDPEDQEESQEGFTKAIYLETNDFRSQVMIQPSLYRRLKKRATDAGLPFSKFLRQILDDATKEG